MKSIAALATVEPVLPPISDYGVISTAAKAAYEKADGDTNRATEILRERALDQFSINDHLLLALLKFACHEAVCVIHRRQRSSIWSPPQNAPTAEQQRDRILSMVPGNLLRFPLPGGKRLGEATADETEHAAGVFEAQATDMAVKARWLRLVASRVKGKRLVGEVLTNEDLQKLQEDARNG